uniref:Uncharacterized protein n=1 Tax=Cacopsylla melanoneura TaxID=428564 RepID=A0A8D8RTH0_9HEMI
MIIVIIRLGTPTSDSLISLPCSCVLILSSHCSEFGTTNMLETFAFFSFSSFIIFPLFFMNPTNILLFYFTRPCNFFDLVLSQSISYLFLLIKYEFRIIVVNTYMRIK